MKTLQTFGHTPALESCEAILKKQGFVFLYRQDVIPDGLLLPVPSTAPDGTIPSQLPKLLQMLPESIPIFGGNLQDPIFQNRNTIDLLKNERFLLRNARITAHCAIREALPHLPVTPDRLPVLVIGWGRIGKELGKLFYSMGSQVTIATGHPENYPEIAALGLNFIPLQHIPAQKYRLIFNTAPVPVLTLKPDCGIVAVDLASKQGIFGEDVLWARGLPGRDAPESAGALMAQAVLEYFHQEVSP